MNFDGLIELLIEQKQVLKTFLDLAGKKRQAIAQNDTDSLNALVGEEVKGIGRLNQLEKKREKLVLQIAREYMMDERDLTLDVVLPKASIPQQQQLNALKRELKTLIDMQSKVNEQNQQLLQSHLEYTEAMLNLIIGNEDPLNNLYGSDGSSGDELRQNPGLFDQQI